ncbi:hypothetical protein [Marinicrinis sediminis]|uniref:Uncharacterized protein n=1 Tax=Marinicrinis sediminis TaxID=1652465 RepID=A0ABW5REG0_9BACL
MAQNGDFYVLVAICVLAVLWLLRAGKNWLFAPAKVVLPLDLNQATEPEPEGAKLLTEEGYEVLCGKIKLPIEMNKDGQRLSSQLFIDYIVRKNHIKYVVKLANRRQPMDWTGSQVRDRLMIYWLAYAPAIEGVIWLDKQNHQLHKVVFHIGGQQ